MKNNIDENYHISLEIMSMNALILRLQLMNIYNEIINLKKDKNNYKQLLFINSNWKVIKSSDIKMINGVGLINYKCRHIYHDIEISIDTHSNIISTMVIDITMDKKKIMDWIEKQSKKKQQ